ncbi:MAG: hypothetical protein HY747_09525 [Elusimicrobia bacterium]|nr:hypothetical protein [Elusimicrobiota bacterium]
MVITFLLSILTSHLSAAAPTSLTWTTVSSNTASISWNGATEAAAFTAVISTTDGFSPYISSGTTDIGQQTTSYFNIAANTTHYFKVKVSTDPDSEYASPVSTVTAIEAPDAVFLDEISTNSLVVSAYARGLGFTNLGQDLSGIAIASGTNYLGWISSNSWRSRADLPSIRRDGAVAVVDGRIYVLGGNDGLVSSRNERYDPETNAWTTLASLPTPRWAIAAVSIGNKIYAIGGLNSSGYYSAVNEMYDPQTNVWTTMAPLQTARTSFAAAAWGKKIYAIGGFFNDSYLSTTEEYDVEGNNWVYKANLPTPREKFSAAVLGGKIYTAGGYDGFVRDNVEIFDPAANQWKIAGPLSSARERLVTAAANGKIYALGGRQFGDTLINTNEEYDPGTARRLTNLSPNFPYSFKAKARNSAGWQTGESAVISSYTAAFAPSLVSTGSFSSVADSSFTVSWQADANQPGTSYYAWITTGIGAAASGWAVMTSSGFSGLLANTTYYAWAKARNNDGFETNWVNLGSTITLARPPLSQASTFTAVAVSSLTFQWQANANPDNTLYIAEISSFVGLSPLTGSSATVLTQAAFFDPSGQSQKSRGNRDNLCRTRLHGHQGRGSPGFGL